MSQVQPRGVDTVSAPKAPPTPTPAEMLLDATIQRCKRSGKPQEAIAAVEEALLADPSNGRLHWRLGEVYRANRQFREAKEVFERAAAASPTIPELRLGLATVCQELKLGDEALGHFEELVRLRPDNPSDWNNLGIARSDKRAFDQAIECYQKAISLDPAYAFAWNNLGNATGYAGRYDESLLAFGRAIDIKPDYAEAYNNRAVTQTQVEHHDAAMEDYARALHLRADYAEAHTNRSLLLLLLGQFQVGWTEYEWRWKGKDMRGRSYAGRRWDGAPVAGKRVLIYAEQGLGDTLQFVRYVRELKGRGATVYVEAQRPLSKLLSRTPGVDKVFHRGEELPPFDYHVPMLSVPGLVGTSLANMPSADPYIVPHEGLTAKWAERLSGYRATFNIGIVWQGNPQHRGDRKRSMPLSTFSPLAGVPGVRLFSLQRGFGTEQIAAGEVPLIDLGNIGVTEDGFLRTAAILKNLDLIVTADTSVAHLAGAMGLPVWIAMSTACDWRWMQGRDDSPWYPSLRLFRQRTAGDWGEVFERIVAAAAPLAATRARHAEPTPDARRRARDLCDRAAKFLEGKEPAQAQPLLEQAVGLDPRSVAAHHDLGLSHLRQRHDLKAAEHFERALEIDPRHANASANLGIVRMHLRQYDEAVSHLRGALRLGAASPAVHNNLGAALAELGDHAAAETHYHTALRLRPDYPGAHYNLSHALFAQGRLEEAWVEHEWRWRMPGSPKRRFKQPRWGGERVDGRTVLLFTEQSVEDAILFARFAALAKDRGGRVILECQPAVAAVLRSCPFVDDVIAAGEPLPDFDVWLPLVSVPGLTRVGRAELPTPIPYLFALGPSIAAMAERLRGIGECRVGIARRGTGAYVGDRRHDLPTDLLVSLASLPNVRLIDLQPSEADVADAAAGGTAIESLTVLADGEGLAEVLTVVSQLDVVVSADNAVAHVAAAAGAEVWTILADACHWRWMCDVEDTPWYPRMRLVRNAASGAKKGRLISRLMRSYAANRFATP